MSQSNIPVPVRHRMWIPGGIVLLVVIIIGTIWEIPENLGPMEGERRMFSIAAIIIGCCLIFFWYVFLSRFSVIRRVVIFGLSLAVGIGLTAASPIRRIEFTGDMVPRSTSPGRKIVNRFWQSTKNKRPQPKPGRKSIYPPLNQRMFRNTAVTIVMGSVPVLPYYLTGNRCSCGSIPWGADTRHLPSSILGRSRSSCVAMTSTSFVTIFEMEESGGVTVIPLISPRFSEVRGHAPPRRSREGKSMCSVLWAT